MGQMVLPSGKADREIGMATNGVMEHVAIRGISCAVPDNWIENEAFVSRFGAENVEKFAKMTGVRRRCLAPPGQMASDMAFDAVEDLIAKLGWERSSIDGIIFVTQSPDYPIPATACVLQHRLKLGKDCLAFDVNLGCSGYVYGLFIAASMCRKNGARRMLLCGGDTSNRGVSPLDRSAAMLFGEAGFATALEFDESAPPWHYLYRTDGSGFRYIITPAVAGACGSQRHIHANTELRECGDGIWRGDHHLFMNGTEVFNFTISEVPSAIKQLMAQADLTPETIDWLVLHQANVFILKNISRMTRIPMTKVPVSMDRYGNTSVTTIPLTLCDALAGKPELGVQRIVMSGFGIGLSLGVVSMELDTSLCLPIGFSTTTFDDGGLDFSNE